MNLATFVLELWDEAKRMRRSGVPLADVQRGLHRSLTTYAKEHGLIVAERDLNQWQMVNCTACNDSGWEPTTRLVRGQPVEAYKRCTCTPQGVRPDYKTKAADTVASRWK